MSLLPAPDAQDQNASSANEIWPRTSQARVSKARKEFHSRKVRCPCTKCHRNRIACMYQDTKPSEEQRSLTSLHNTPNAAYKELRGIPGELGGLSGGHSIVHSRPLDPKRDHGTEAFSSKELHRLFQSYVEHVHTLYPCFDNPQEMCDKFINDPVLRKGNIVSCPRNACVLLFFALGSFQSTTDSTGSLRPLPGFVYYSYAKDIIEYQLGERNIFVAQALTLAALYMNQNGMLPDSCAHLSNAEKIYIDVANNGSMSREANRSVWTHLNLKNGIGDCFNWDRLSPVPQRWVKLLQEGNVEQFPERVYWTKVSLRNLLDTLQDIARPHLLTTRKIDEENLCALETVTNEQFIMLERWRFSLNSPLSWNDQEPPSTDPLIATLRAEYYEGMAKLLRPYVGIALQCNFKSTEDELSKGQSWILRVVLLWAMYNHFSIGCFDRVGAAPNSTYEMHQDTSGSPVMLSNPVSTLHTKTQTALLFGALRLSPIYPSFTKQTRLIDETIDELRRRTIKSLSEFRPGHPILSRDLEALNRL